MARGNHRQGIFRDDADRAAYLDRFEYYRGNGVRPALLTYVSPLCFPDSTAVPPGYR